MELYIILCKISWYFYYKYWFHRKGHIYSIRPIILEKEIIPPPPPPRESYFCDYMCGWKNWVQHLVLREDYIRLATCKLIGPGAGEIFTPAPESHKFTIKDVDKKSRCNLFIDSTTDNIESVSHWLLAFCLLEKNWLIRKPSNYASKINPMKAALTF